MITGTLKKIIATILFILINITVFGLPYNKYSIRRSSSYTGERKVHRRYSRVKAYRGTRRRRPVRRNKRKARRNIKKIRTVIGDNFIITLKRKNIDGIWAISNYSKQFLELLENRRSVKNTYFIFKPIKNGVAVVRMVFKTRRGIRDRENYTVAVLTPKEYRKSIAKIEDDKQNKLKPGSKKSASNSDNRKAEKISISNPDEENNSQENNSEPTNTEQEKSQFGLIKDMLSRKAYDHAIKEAEAFIKKYQNSRFLVDVIILAGKAYNGLKQNAKAVALYSMYINKVKNPNISYPVYFARAKGYEKMGRDKQAQIEYIKMLSKFKSKPQILARTHLLLGKLYLKNKNFTLGLNELERLVKRFPDQGDITAEAYYHLGRNYYKTKGIEDYEKSYKSFHKLIISFPDSRYAVPARRMARYLRMNYINYR